MLKSNALKVLQVFILVLGLVSVRAFEEQLFYDPFIKFFKGNFTSKPLPEVSQVKLLFSYFTRFAINSFLSLLIIFVLFKKSSYVKIAVTLYIILFVVLESALVIFINLNYSNTYVYLFYVRRFMIQPLFLLLFIGAFYYQSYARRQNIL